MNADRYARVTLVLNRSTDDGLSYLSRRLRVSKSELVRDVLAEPVEGMVGLLKRHPEGQEIDPRQLALDGLELGESLLESVEGPLAKIREVAHGR